MPKEDTTTNKTKAVMNTETNQREFATDQMILESNGILVPIKKEPLVKIEGDKQQTEFEKVMGKSEAEFVVDIRKDSDKAIDQNSELDYYFFFISRIKIRKIWNYNARSCKNW